LDLSTIQELFNVYDFWPLSNRTWNYLNASVLPAVEALAAASRIYRAGIARKGVAACSACHGPDGSGNAQAGFPRISGQPAAYTIAQLTAYRERLRATDELYGGMMRGVAEGLTDTEIALVASYIEGLY